MNDNELIVSPDSGNPPRIVNALCEGDLQLAEGAIPLTVAVLEDGTRLIGRNDMFRAFGRTQRGRAKGEIRAENLPSFADAKNLQPYISQELYEILTSPIKCRTSSGRLIDGYRAIALPLLCDAYLDAKNANKLTVQQLPLAVAALAIVRSLSKIGIIALIDEATGYQYDREKDELQKILKAYIGEELLEWRKRFPDEFYREIFRLNGWDFTVKGIQQRPGIIGTWTKYFIYSQLPKGVLPAMEKKVLRTASGKLRNKLHQALSADTGLPHLEKQLVSVVTLMNISSTWPEFKQYFERKFGQQMLDFGDKQLPPVEPINPFDAGLKGLLSIPPPPKPEKRKKKPKPPKDDEADGESAAELVPA